MTAVLVVPVVRWGCSAILLMLTVCCYCNINAVKMYVQVGEDPKYIVHRSSLHNRPGLPNTLFGYKAIYRKADLRQELGQELGQIH